MHVCPSQLGLEQVGEHQISASQIDIPQIGSPEFSGVQNNAPRFIRSEFSHNLVIHPPPAGRQEWPVFGRAARSSGLKSI